MASMASISNVTHTDLVHGWVSTSCGRGTADIIWSCLATILLCTWTALHLPVPNGKGAFVSGWTRKVPGLFMTVLAPETLSTIAFSTFLGALQAAAALRRLGVESCTLTHGYFLTMDGFRLRSPKGDVQILDLDHVRYIADVGNVNRFQRSSKSFDAGHVLDFQQADWVHRLRETREATVLDLAKSDGFTKLATCVQALWLLTQVISRWIQGLSATLLEISSIAFVVCGMLAYGAWWKRPQDCMSPIIFDCSEQEFHASKEARIFGSGDDNVSILRTTRESFAWIQPRSRGLTAVLCISYLTSSLFAAIHAAAWNYPFPTTTEKHLWRLSVLACLLLPGLVLSAFGIGAYKFSIEEVDTCTHVLFRRPWRLLLRFRLRDCVATLLLLTVYIGSVLYVAVRLFMIIETFISFRALPSSAFQSVSWSGLIPHV